MHLHKLRTCLFHLYKHRHLFRHTLYLAALLFTIGFAPAATKLEATQPNIIFVLSDDQAWNGLSTRMHPD